MKFPTLTRLPNYRRFNVEPRYYDPVKEDIEERTSRIKQEISQLREGGSSHQTSGIAGSFSRRANYTKNANILQMVILISLIIFIGGYLLYGNDIFYIFLLIVPIYFYIRIRKYSKRR
ncbi:hypothetical protein PZB74_07900 [Porifericola rhodea]|uniref:hypothetical protein n=1 Tax=Porifericola rhodea TaxID=930972 RepID=UPI00266504D2|nr:hypothetical protein [Porifericola rhodea]WKN33261.1 hypothetical protein PZB74_07900 [Porifericola rhodea]